MNSVIFFCVSGILCVVGVRILLISCVNVGDWDEAECFDYFSDFVIVFDSLYLLSEWIHFGWSLVFSGGGDC